MERSSTDIRILRFGLDVKKVDKWRKVVSCFLRVRDDVSVMRADVTLDELNDDEEEKGNDEDVEEVLGIEQREEEEEEEEEEEGEGKVVDEESDEEEKDDEFGVAWFKVCDDVTSKLREGLAAFSFLSETSLSSVRGLPEMSDVSSRWDTSCNGPVMVLSVRDVSDFRSRSLFSGSLDS
jgi:hypothetical protein